MKSVEHVEEGTQAPASYRLSSTARSTHRGKFDRLSVPVPSEKLSTGKVNTTVFSVANYRVFNPQSTVFSVANYRVFSRRTAPKLFIYRRFSFRETF